MCLCPAISSRPSRRLPRALGSGRRLGWWPRFRCSWSPPGSLLSSCSSSAPGLTRRAAVAAADVAPGRAWLWATIGLSAGAFALAVALAPPADAPPGTGLGWVLFVASSGHVACTAWFYSVREVRAHAAANRTRYLVAPALLVLASAALAATLPPGDTAWLLPPYFGWQFFHFQKQNLGLAALAASSTGAPSLSRPERRAILAAGWAGIAGLLVHPT